jgi:hypothetical protein
MKTHSKNTNPVFTQFQILNIDSFSGYPLYPLNKDIYKRPSKILDIDFEEISSKKTYVNSASISKKKTSCFF